MDNQDIHLLVVDDNESNRDIIARQLRRRGYDVVTAADGERAIAIVDAQPIDLIILDIMMPGIDGLEVLSRLRRTHSAAQLPIIMASAKSDSPDIVKSAELGANDHVGKPLDFDIVLAKVQALLRLKEAASPPPGKATGEPTIGELEAGAVIAGKYRLLDKIGTGTFGAVYRARHLELDFDVAVKILLPSVTANEQSLKRFRQEGVAACRVRHPNAVTIYDGGATETGVAFLVMELLEGESLADELKTSNRLSPQRTNQILQPVCNVLAAGHAQDLVHRDLTPENIFLQQTNQGDVVKVLDFGIAKLVGEATIRENLTAEGWILGTPAYIAPERLGSGGYDGRADVYSLGIMAFEMMTGQRPFKTSKDDPMSLMSQHVHEKPRKLRDLDADLPEELEQPIALALSKNPKKRPDAIAFAQAFGRSIAQSEPTEKFEIPRPLPRSSASSLPVEEQPTLTLSDQQADDEPKSGILGRWLNKRRKT